MTNLTNNLMYIKNTYMHRRRRKTATRRKREMTGKREIAKGTDRENIEMSKLANKSMYKFQ